MPSYILTLIFFTFLGFRHVGSGVFDEATLDSYRATLNGIFKIGWVSLLPLILVVVLLIRKVAAFISILMGALFGVFVAYFYQGRGFSPRISAAGMDPETGNPELIIFRIAFFLIILSIIQATENRKGKVPK